MVQEAIDVVEDGPLVDFLVFVVFAELLQRPIGDVLAAFAAVFGVGVEGEALARASANCGIGHTRRSARRRESACDLYSL